MTVPAAGSWTARAVGQMMLQTWADSRVRLGREVVLQLRSSSSNSISAFGVPVRYLSMYWHYTYKATVDATLASLKH